jgi:DNA-nicking Smr family endonuclease
MPDKYKEDAFLKSIKGASPIKKQNKIKKPIPETKKNNHIKKLIIQKNIPNKTKNINLIKNNSFFEIQKTDLNKKLKKGKIPIDKKKDLHGLSLFEAEQVFITTIVDCFKVNKRCILFITGKGIINKNKKDLGEERLYYGKIRNNFLEWTRKEELKKHILSVEQANIEFGGDGAFFVYLRKNKN